MDFGGGDIAAGIRICIDIYRYGFSPDNAADVRFINFRNDVHNLEALLRTLRDAIRKAHERHRTRLSLDRHRQSLDPLTTDFENERIAVIGNFNATLEECQTFLDSKKKYTTNRSNPLENLGWHLLQDEQRVNDLRQRIAFHMFKIRFVIDRLSLDILSDIDADVGDTLALVEENLDVSNATFLEVKKFRSELFGYLAGQRGLPLQTMEDQHTVPLAVHQKFQEALDDRPSTATAIPLSDWFDALLYTFEQSNEGPDQTPETYLAFLKARWLMDTVRQCTCYKDARPGFYLKRACNQIDKALRARLRNPGDLIQFDEAHLLELPSACFAIWKPAVSNLPTEIDLKLTEPQGETELVKIHLANEFPGSSDTLTVLKRSDLQFRAVRDITSLSSSQQVLVPVQIDVRYDNLVPRYLLPTLAGPCLEMSIYSRGSENSYRFRSLTELYDLQGALTGFDVSHDQKQITCQFSKNARHLDCEKARIQFWQEPLESQASDHPSTPGTKLSNAVSSGSQAGTKISFAATSTVAQTSEGFEAQRIKKCAIMLFSKYNGDSRQHLFNISCIPLSNDCYIDNTLCACRRDYDTCSKLVLVRPNEKPFSARYRDCDLQSFDLLEFRASSDFQNAGVTESKHVIFKFPSLEEKVTFHREIKLRFAVRDAQLADQRNFGKAFRQRQDQPQRYGQGLQEDGRRSSSTTTAFAAPVRLPQLPAIDSGPEFSGFLSSSPSSRSTINRTDERRAVGLSSQTARRAPGNDADSAIGIDDFEKQDWPSRPRNASGDVRPPRSGATNSSIPDEIKKEAMSSRSTFASASSDGTRRASKTSGSGWKLWTRSKG